MQEFKVISMEFYPVEILTAFNNSIQEAGGQPLFKVTRAHSKNKRLTIGSDETQRYLARKMAHPRNFDENEIAAQEDLMLKAQAQLLRAEKFKDGYLEIKDRFSKTMLNEDNLMFYFFKPAGEILQDFAIQQLERASQKKHRKRADSPLKKDFETVIKGEAFQERLEQRVSQIYNVLLEESPELNEAVNERVMVERKLLRDRNYQSIEDIMKQSLEDMFHLIVIPLLDHQV